MNYRLLVDSYISKRVVQSLGSVMLPPRQRS